MTATRDSIGLEAISEVTGARYAALNESGWSNLESSTQDDSPPASSAGPLAAYQNNLTFDVPYTASDATSGVASVELFYQVDSGGYSSYGTFTSSPISFTASGDGFYEFYTVATDNAGNAESAPVSADASTTVDTGLPDAPTMTAEPAYTPGTTNTVAWSDESASGATEYYAEAAFLTTSGNNGGYKITKLGFDKLPIWSALAKTFIESYWIAVKSMSQQKTKGEKGKDVLKNMEHLGRRFHELGLIDHIGALSQINYKNAMGFIKERVLNLPENSEEDRSHALERLSQLGQRLYELSHYRA